MAKYGDNMTGLKMSNRSSALMILHEEKTISRKRLAEKMGLTAAAVTKIISEMIEEGLVIEGQAISARNAGRREIEISINPHSHCALGMFINSRQTILSAVWMDGTVIFSRTIETEEAAPADATVEMLCRELLNDADTYISDKSKILGIGIAARGIVSADGRVLKNSFGALDTLNYPIADKVEELTSYRCTMENNVRALFDAHAYLTNAESVPSTFFLRCEYGIGATLSIDGKTWSGATQQCSEIGHIPFVRSGGKLCSCGKRGCLETVASPNAIVSGAKEILLSRGEDVSDIDIDKVLEMAQRGDNEIKEVVDKAVLNLGFALKSVLYTIDPSEIVLYGRMFNSSYYLSKLMAEMEQGIDVRHRLNISKSSMNLLLEDKAAGLAMVKSFIECGGRY